MRLQIHHIIYYIMALLLLSGCTADDQNGDDRRLGSDAMDGVVYTGTWNVGHRSYSGEMAVSATQFKFNNVPVANYLRELLPDSTVKDVTTTSFGMTYLQVGGSDMTVIYYLSDNEWTTQATINGHNKRIALCFYDLPSMYGIPSSQAMSSRLSEQSLVTMQMTRLTITDIETGSTNTLHMPMKLTFITNDRKTRTN